MAVMQPQVLDFQYRDPEDVLERARQFRNLLRPRRTVRDFSDRPVPREVIEQLVMTAGGAPSGANQQPWTFVCISDPDTKRRIREAAEEEEKAFYAGKAGEEWLEALEHLGTDWEKPFLERAPWLIAIFAHRHGVGPDGARIKHYYVPESVGIASGFLIAACHNAGLASLTHTPAPMGFLNEICGRPDNEKPVILLVVGYPAETCTVPTIRKKPLEEIAVFI
ncbi:MAG TPA: nitroreductase family protein [Beijerinckiaceae bacterium]|nr:nitroreductase family protein [Beijerinckiaceae bacterium]